MPATLIPPALLEKPGKILFVMHLAIGDYAYLENFFRALAAARPQLEIHIWVDELRRTADPARWDSLKKYALYDWLAACPFIKKVYNQTYSPALYEQSIAEARAQNYPIVVSLVLLRAREYARLARQLSPSGFVAGVKKPYFPTKLHYYLSYKKLDAPIHLDKPTIRNLGHITELYADWFERLFALRLPVPARYPRLDIPAQRKTQATNHLREHGIDTASDTIVFINTLSKSPERCWPMPRAIELIKTMQQTPRWKNAWFLLNAMPEDLAATRKTIADSAPARTLPFSASDNFFELPAMLAECDLIISVETATMHLASAVQVPVVALMRRNNPEWRPIDTVGSTVIMLENRKDWIDKITVADVLEKIEKLKS